MYISYLTLISQFLQACVDGNLKDIQVKWNTNMSAVGVVIASKGYPETSTKGCVISGEFIVKPKKKTKRDFF